MSLMMTACCCGQCECPTTVCHTFYYIELELIYTDCQGNYPCSDGLHYYFSALHYSNSCTPPSAADILALYKAGSVSFCPAEGFLDPCSGGGQVQIEYVYPSCTLVSSVTNQICAQTYTYSGVGPFVNSHSPTYISTYSSGFIELGYNLTYVQAWKLTGVPDPECGADYDVGVFGVSFTTPACVLNAPAGCCP